MLQWPGFPLSLKTHAFTKLHFDQEHGRLRTKATTESLFIKPFQDIECHSGRLNQAQLPAASQENEPALTRTRETAEIEPSSELDQR